MPRNNSSSLMARIPGLTEMLHHRGPDDAGTAQDGAVCFGHARLSIIGLTAREAAQPVQQNGRLLSYNGEIYNYQALNEKLLRQGIQVTGASDTETLFQCLNFWGVENTLQELDGMFAFAWYDAASAELYLVRDRIGEKPLYWANGREGFWFASEIKAILASGDVDHAPNLRRMDDYFFTYKVNGAETLFKHIQEVEPGTYIKLNRRDHLPESKCYWRIEAGFWSGDPDGPCSDHTQFHDQLNRAIVSRGIADVPIGVLLSGGIDSNAMTDIFLESGSADSLDLFFADNANPKVSEREDAEAFLEMANHRHPDAALNFHPNIVKFEDYQDTFAKLTWFYDEPVQFANSPLLYSLCQDAHDRNVKVLFSGEGADELLFGYDRFVRTANLLSNESDPLRKIEHLYYGGGLHSRGVVEKLTKALSAGAAETESWQWLRAHIHQPLDQLQLIYSQKFRMQTLLQRQDRIGMAESIEIRVPFLAPWFVDFANRLPHYFKYDAETNTTKKLLRETMQDRLPSRILTKAKDGFPTDMEIWLRQDRMKQRLLEMVTDSASFTAQYLPSGYVMDLVRDHFSGKSHLDVIIWQLFALETWHGVFADGVETNSNPRGVTSS